MMSFVFRLALLSLLVEAALSFGLGEPRSFAFPVTPLFPSVVMSELPDAMVDGEPSSGILGPGGPLSPEAQDAVGQVGNALDGASGLLYNIAVGATAIVFVGAGLTYLIASLVIPAAAKELEKECKELNPALWDEYIDKLEPGETMDRRPDLMQELGAKLQPLLDQKIAKMNEGTYSPPTDSSDATSDAASDVIVDATVIEVTSADLPIDKKSSNEKEVQDS